MKAFSATALTALLFAGILTLWVPDRWAVSLYQAAAFGLAIAWAVRFLWRPFAIHGSVLLIPMFAALLWGLAQLALGRTVYRWETWMAVLQWGANLVLFLLALQLFRDPFRTQRFLNAVLIFGAAIGVIACIQMYSSGGRVFWIFPTEYKDLVLGPFLYRNQYAGFIELILPLALFGALEDRRRMPVYVAVSAALYASVLAAASRAGSILVTAEIIAIFFLAKRRRAAAFGMLAAFAFLFTAIAGPTALWRHFLEPDPNGTRREFLQSSIAMIRDRPWMGFGLGTWPAAYPGYAIFDNGLFANQAHNDWAQWTVEGGVPFLFCMLSLAALAARPALRSVWGIGALAVFVHCLVDYPLERPALAGFFFVFLGVMEAARDPERIP